MRKIRISSLAALVVAALGAAACADGSRSPLGPSAVSHGSEMLASSVDVDRSLGTVDPGSAREWAVNSGWMTAADGLMVEGSDEISAVTGTCPDRVITVRGVPVSINSGTTLGPGVTCAALAAGMTVHIAGLLTVNGGAYSVIATAITVDAQSGEGGGAPDETGGTPGGPGRRRGQVGGEGTVANLAGTCPTLTMVVRGVRVRTSAATEFVDAACGNLRNGTKVEVEGNPGSDGGLDATRVRIVDQPGGGGHGRVSGEGTVAAVRGTCPTLTMVIRGYAVMTSENTTYVGAGSCETLRPGVKVHVTGVNQANSLMAETIEFKD